MRRRLALLATAALIVSGCSSDEGDATADEAGPVGSAATTDAATTEAACDQGATMDEVEAAPVAGVDSDIDVTSFDGTTIRAHWFPNPGNLVRPVPTILMGPGWSQPGDTSQESNPILGALGIGALNERGYNVLTWDPRGFGASTGTATVNAPEAEGRDLQVLLDWVAEQPEAETDADGDPRVGMVGASYGGGIQLTLAAIDCRVDALVPNIAWHSLETSLYPHETVKAGWSGVLTSVASGASLDPHITSAAQSGLATGTLSDEDRQWFVDRGPGDLVEAIRTPTLLVHGTVDTLFTLHEAITNFEILQANDVPVAMLWYCGGHGACLTDAGDPDHVTDAAFAWLDRHVRGDTTAAELPVVDVIDQDGQRWTGDDHPSEPDGSIGAGSAGGTLALTTASAAGPLVDAVSADLLTGLVSPITPARADVALELTVTARRDALVLGAPHLALTYSGTTPEGPEPTRLFAQLVDAGTGLVLGNQITPVPVELDGEEHTVEIDLEVVAHHLAAGDEILLQVVATTPAFATPRLGGAVDVTEMSLELPTTGALTPT
ncbi:peptidase S15 [Iamia sp. SCSIO 61187]|uniref:S15 peptidase family protein n=1 Tax=Iamia sp. SCSIO 61187 TaxID=2722752 RepID=UPI001C63965E|nr:CocE/NonD family hydrolase [Iamia sp. SCSIO 61187]QYG92006.1 peptidase S15 [Iamia sp. SCSIO 61187]